MKKYLILIYIIGFIPQLYSQQAAKGSFRNQHICFFKIGEKNVEKYISKYLNRNQIRNSKGVVYLKITLNTNNNFEFYISSFIYKSELNINRPKYYTIINGQTILLYGAIQTECSGEKYKAFYLKLTQTKLIDDINKNGTVNKDLIPVNYDPERSKLLFKGHSLISKKNINKVPGILYRNF